MTSHTSQVKAFFKLYADSFNNALRGELDIEATAKSFSSCFIGANPSGVICGHNDAQLRTMLAKGYEFYNSIGVTGMNILTSETMPLDEIHQMTRIRWQCAFTKKAGPAGTIEFDNIYLTQRTDSQIRIFAYITGDEQTALKEHGLI